MSYDIFYNKQFIKLRHTGEVIPMFLAGSNNCYDIGNGGRNGRRARDWQSFLYYNRKGKLSEKPGIILKNLDADLRKVIRRNNGKDSYEKAKPSDIRKRWGYYSAIVVGSGSCGGTSWDRWRRQFANGIKHALTIEELDKLGVNPYFSSYGDSPDGKPAEIGLNTESQYFTELKKWREWQAKSQRSFSLSFSPNNTDTVLSRLHANKHRTPREKQRVEQAHYFTLTDGSSALIKYTSRGYKYSWNKTGGKKFMTEKEAEDYRKQLVAKERYKAEIWKVERINSPCNFYV